MLFSWFFIALPSMIAAMTHPHQPILVPEILSFFSERTVRTFVDGTLGAGGHAEAVLSAHPELENFIGIDQDVEALEIARKRLSAWSDKITYIHGNFAAIDSYLSLHHLKKVDGILLDLGVSSMQLDRPERGFSFMRDGPLDMRMDPSEGNLSAANVVNNWSEKDLGRIFRDYGEEKRWRAAARAIVAARGHSAITTTFELVAALQPAFPPQPAWKGRPRIHPMTLVFQALRICVNRELEVLEEILKKAIDLLAPKGIFAIISFHSLEDRIVKNAFRFAADDKESTSGIGGVFKDKTPQVVLKTRKAVIPGDAEMEQNPRARSAKLRVIEKI
jgi:16S rRNA (cytosine1402-N4)-methyltransferase